MTSHDFETRLRSELRLHRAEPTAGMRERILARLADGAVTDDSPATATVPTDDAQRRVKRLVAWTAGLAASLLALVALRGATQATEPQGTVDANRSRWTAEWTDSAADLESDLLVQGDLLADDARRAAAGLLERMPAAPWARRTDRR